jgi:hypothetical protein
MAKSTLKKLLTFQNFLALVFTIYIVFNYQPNMYLASMVTNASGYFMLFVFFILIARYFHPIVTLIYVVMAYELIKRSHFTLQKPFDKYLPSEATRNSYMKEAKHFEPTLEEDVIESMVPAVTYGESNSYSFTDNVDKSIPSTTYHA